MLMPDTFFFFDFLSCVGVSACECELNILSIRIHFCLFYLLSNDKIVHLKFYKLVKNKANLDRILIIFVAVVEDGGWW